MTLDAALRDLVRDFVKTEVLPAVREELRAALAAEQHGARDAEYLTVAEAADLAKVDDDTVRNWIKGRMLPARRLPDRRHYRIRRADLDALLSPNGAGDAPGVDPVEEATRVMSLAQARMKKNGGR